MDKCIKNHCGHIVLMADAVQLELYYLLHLQCNAICSVNYYYKSVRIIRETNTAHLNTQRSLSSMIPSPHF